MGHSTNGKWAKIELSMHSEKRMSQRGIGEDDILMVLNYGRLLHSRNAYIYVVGKKEVKEAQKEKVNLQKYEGIHVISTIDGTVLTVYRNKNLNIKDNHYKHSH